MVQVIELLKYKKWIPLEFFTGMKLFTADDWQQKNLKAEIERLPFYYAGHQIAEIQCTLDVIDTHY